MTEVPGRSREDPELAFRIDDAWTTSRGVNLVGAELVGDVQPDMHLGVAGHCVRVVGTSRFLPLPRLREPVGLVVVGADLDQLVAGVGTVVGICHPDS